MPPDIVRMLNTLREVCRKTAARCFEEFADA